MKTFGILILIMSIHAVAAPKFVCSKTRESFVENVTYKSKISQSCSKLCGLAFERSAALSCGRHGIDMKIKVLEDGVKACGMADAQNTSCTIQIQCDVCPR